MGTYSAIDGFASDWHVAHIGKLAAGGAGLVIVERISVNVRSRITHGCLGIWKDEHVPGMTKLVDISHCLDAKIGIQIGHGGRESSSQRPWEGGGPLGEADLKARNEGPWQPMAPSSIALDDGWPSPHMPPRWCRGRLSTGVSTRAGSGLRCSRIALRARSPPPFVSLSAFEQRD